MKEPRKTIRLKAFSGPGWHNVSLDRKTCDCSDFESPAAPCKHLNALGIFRFRPFVSKARPTFSQALSALVKSLRTRRVEDAVYWLVYLDTFPEVQHRIRVARRLLIGSAEDGHSVTVMEKVVDGFRLFSKRQTELQDLVAEAVRICKIPNWWHPSTGGPDYIYSGMVGERELAYSPGERSLETMTKLIEQGIEEGTSPRGPGGPPSNYAESPALRKLSGIAQECVRHIWRVRRCETIFAPALSRAFHRYTLLRE